MTDESQKLSKVIDIDVSEEHSEEELFNSPRQPHNMSHDLNYSQSEIIKESRNNTICQNDANNSEPEAENEDIIEVVTPTGIEQVQIVNGYNNDLLCTICTRLPILSAITKCKKCESYFCLPCIEKEVDLNEGHCYTAGCKQFKAKNLDKVVMSLLKSLRIKCSYEDCSETINYDDYEEHMKLCEFQPKKCEFCCEVFSSNKNLEEHLKGGCPYSTKACQLCGVSFYLKDHIGHVNHCDYNTIICEDGCKDRFYKKDYNKHQVICPKLKKICKTCKVPYLQAQIGDHSCYDTINEKYLKLLDSKIELEEEVKVLIKRNSDLKVENEDTITNYSNASNQKDKEINDLKNELKNLTETNEKLKTDYENLLKKMFVLNDSEKLYEKYITLEQEAKTLRDENANLKIFNENHKLTINELKKAQPFLDKDPTPIYKIGVNKVREEEDAIENIQVVTKIKSFRDPDSSIKSNYKLVSERKNSRYVCAVCGSDIDMDSDTNDSSTQNCCGKCYNPICLYCRDTCFVCFGIFCEKDISSCELCGKTTCSKDVNICSGCGLSQCSKCFHSERLCPNCNWQFDILNKDKLIVIDNNGLSCKTYNTSSCIANLVLGSKVFVGGFHKWEVKIKSSICKLTDFGIVILPNKEVNVFSPTKQIRTNQFDYAGKTTSDKLVKAFNYVSAKDMAPAIQNRLFHNSFVVTLDLNLKIFAFEVDEIKIERKLDGNYFLPYFLLCNNSLNLKHIFTVSNT